MDRKSNKKIGRYAGLYLVFAVLFTIGMYLIADHMTALRQEQMLTMLVKHPELEAEIIAMWEKPHDDNALVEEDREKIEEAAGIIEEKYGYDLAGVDAFRIVWLVWGAGLGLGALGAVILWYLDHSRMLRSSGTKEMVQELYECLERFREGDYHSIPDVPAKSEEWMKLWETVRELGVYFEDMKLRLAEEEDSTKALITDISHQLKTPLASLRMSYELVAGEDLTDEERAEFQVQEAREIEKLEMLLGELVELSRLETHMIQIRPVRGSLKKTITEAVTHIYVKANNKNIGIEVDMDGDIQISHDPKWTAEAIENVLDNAVKYSGEDTTVTVRVSTLVQNVLIEIMDEGMGIKSEELHKIYHRFYRGKEAQKKVEEGAGVGLYLTRKILEEQGGTISARARSGPGTVFKITLPC